MRAACALASDTGYAVFPVRADKTPRLKWQSRASSDPTEIAAMWRQCPDPLIGIATGQVSGVWVLDIDIKHQDAIDWWSRNDHRIPETRIYRTRSGGLHAYFRDGGEQRNSAGRLAEGVDIRGNGGYVVAWFAAGWPCEEDSPPAPWPSWIARALASKVATRPAGGSPLASTEAAIGGIVRTLANAREGSRNHTLFWCACCLAERGWSAARIEGELLPVCHDIGLPAWEARLTIASAVRHVGS